MVRCYDVCLIVPAWWDVNDVCETDRIKTTTTILNDV
jgi:hypothetical protein